MPAMRELAPHRSAGAGATAPPADPGGWLLGPRAVATCPRTRGGAASLRAALLTALLAALATGLAAPASAEPPLDADQWSSRVAEALRVGETMTGRARLVVVRPGDRNLDFSFDALRQPWRAGSRTVFQMQQAGDAESIVSELVVEPGQPLVNWFWDMQKRRWLSVRGLLATDPWADSGFHHEDLWFTDPAERRRGSVREVEEGGRRYVELHSEAYHYYSRVETRIDPETALPVRVRFIDVTGAPVREQLFESVEVVSGRPYPKRVQMRELTTGAESTLTWERLEFQRKIPPSFLDLSVLHDRITKGVDPVPLDSLPEPRDPGGT